MASSFFLAVVALALVATSAALRLDPVTDVMQGVARASTPMLVNGAMSPAARAAAAAAVAPMRAQLRNTTDCASSLLFYEFSLALLPLRDARDVFESLKLDLLGELDGLLSGIESIVASTATEDEKTQRDLDDDAPPAPGGPR